MNGGYAMLDFSGVTTGTHPKLAEQITNAIKNKKIIVGYNINGQSPVVMVADSSGVLTGGGITVSVSGSTVTISAPASGTIVSDIRKISGTKEQSITASTIQTVIVPLTIPTGYEIVGVSKIIASGVSAVVALSLRGWQQSSTGITVYFSNTSASTGTATVDVDVIVAKVQGSNSRDYDEPVEKTRKGRK